MATEGTGSGGQSERFEAQFKETVFPRELEEVVNRRKEIKAVDGLDCVVGEDEESAVEPSWSTGCLGWLFRVEGFGRRL